MYEPLYKTLYRIRRVEEEIARIYPSDKLKSPVHLSIVQEAVAAAMSARGESTDRTDGVTVDHPDWWFNLRPSNTEPLLRLNVEARTESECATHVREVLDLVAELSG